MTAAACGTSYAPCAWTGFPPTACRCVPSGVTPVTKIYGKYNNSTSGPNNLYAVFNLNTCPNPPPAPAPPLAKPPPPPARTYTVTPLNVSGSACGVAASELVATGDLDVNDWGGLYGSMFLDENRGWLTAAVGSQVTLSI